MTVDVAWASLFPQDLIPKIVQDVIDCSQNLQRPPNTEKRPEEALSKQLFNRLILITRYRTGPLEPHIESWLPDLESRADIRFSCGKGIETYFIFEAKRLYVTFSKGKLESLVPKYINDGMMRFISGRYAPQQESSAMLAYVYDKDVVDAQQEISKKIKTAAKELFLKNAFNNSALPVAPSIHETQHTLPSKTFTIYHIFTKV